MKPSQVELCSGAAAASQVRSLAPPSSSLRAKTTIKTMLATLSALVCLMALCCSEAAAADSKIMAGQKPSGGLSSVPAPRKDSSPTDTAELRWAESALNKQSKLEPSADESNIANAKVRVEPSDMQAAAGHHHGKSHGKYYMYTEVPKKHSYKMGFKRGNHKHQIERKESVHKEHVHSYFKWHDKKGKGSHKFEYKHHDKKKHHGHY